MRSRFTKLRYKKGNWFIWFYVSLHFLGIGTVDRHENALLRAEDGIDFKGFENEVLTFPAGNRIQYYTVELADDVDVGKPEYFEVCLSNPMFGYIKSPACAMIYIEDDDCE